ncbi:sulfatase family protein [Streptomyces sp. TP-A0874]|uniref:sulfatase family protein n=1 Tax=Streptomyces sp. TP-A0874 TaxID=549819 RepID=UPI000853686E|nr:sulfatase-like hydrolase/transferase [Streptomyces sp. TP-A0874]
MPRNILLITTDQQRYDALGCNGGTLARTPVVDELSSKGLTFRRAYNQSTVCMPARSTILTGQYTRTHGVWANGVPLPADAPSVAGYLAQKAGYRTALIGKAHFEPNHDDTANEWEENARAVRGETGPWRGFDHSLQASHGPSAGFEPMLGHYGYWLAREHPEYLAGFPATMTGAPGGDTGAPEARYNPIPRELYHTDWLADRAIDYLDGLGADEHWFLWLSFPDPHHPFSPPGAELDRVPWQDVELPPEHPGSPELIRKILERKPAHWLAFYEGRWRNQEGAPRSFLPAEFTDDQLREVLAKTAVMNELIDEACGRVLDRVRGRGWEADTDVFFTTDHGDLLGNCGLLFKGPFPTDALMRLPFVWRPAPSAGVVPAEIAEPVGHLDLAPTFCQIAGVEPPDWMEGEPLPTAPGSGRERVLSEYDSKVPGIAMHMRTIYRDGWLATVYEPSTIGQPTGLEELVGPGVLESYGVEYDGTEGELYNVEDDPHQWENRWDEPSARTLRDDLVRDLYDHLPEAGPHRLRVEAVS